MSPLEQAKAAETVLSRLRIFARDSDWCDCFLAVTRFVNEARFSQFAACRSFAKLHTSNLAH